MNIKHITPRKLSVFVVFLVRILPHSDQKNSKYIHFLCSAYDCRFTMLWVFPFHSKWDTEENWICRPQISYYKFELTWNKELHYVELKVTSQTRYFAFIDITTISNSIAFLAWCKTRVLGPNTCSALTLILTCARIIISTIPTVA